jgi:pyruvate-formate lyase-activating enzyme
MDIKIIDRDKHKEYTGVYNDLILKNFTDLKTAVSFL